MDLGLKAKVAVITGGNAGIGAAVADGLAREGVHVVLCGRNQESLATKAKEIADNYGVKALGVRADVTMPADISNLLAEVDKAFGGADILVNNAGLGSDETVMDASDEKWQFYWDLHVMAAVRLSRGLVPSMRKRGGGVILNNASMCAVRPCKGEPIYNVTKAALEMFSRHLANELIPYNIRVNCINPGLILTQPWIDHAKAATKGTDSTWESHLDRIAQEGAPIGRFATPEEVAGLFVFLCSDQASYIVGSTYDIDGGFLSAVI